VPPEATVFLDAASKLGALGLAVIVIALFLSGRIRVGTLVDGAKKEADDERAKITQERDDWKSIAQAATPELRRLNDLLDTAIKLLFSTSRLPPP
jgi:hypothetical protein